MIHYLVTAEHAYTMRSYLESRGAALASRISIVSYDSLFAGARLPERGAAYIFSDLDRLSDTGRAALGPLHDHLVRLCGAGNVLNDPRRSLLRLELLQTLYRLGINDFNAWRLSDPARPWRYPVFVREEAGFQHAQLPLLRSAEEYEAAIRALRLRNAALEGLIAVEYCDSADARGVFRKFGAFIVGGRIVPRHVYFSRNWMVKHADLADPALIAEERAFVDGNPHAGALWRVFDLARISYGRIDYGLLGGRVQVWEVNTNPAFAGPAGEDIAGRGPVHLKFFERIASALAAFDAGVA